MKASGNTAREVKTANGAKFLSVDEYIASLPVSTRGITRKVRKAILKAAPGAGEDISYNMPTLKINGRCFIWFATWKEHISIYPRTREMETSITELKGYKGEKGTIKFPLNQPFPFDLVAKIVTYLLVKASSGSQKSA